MEPNRSLHSVKITHVTQLNGLFNTCCWEPVTPILHLIPALNAAILTMTTTTSIIQTLLPNMCKAATVPLLIDHVVCS